MFRSFFYSVTRRTWGCVANSKTKKIFCLKTNYSGVFFFERVRNDNCKMWYNLFFVPFSIIKHFLKVGFQSLFISNTEYYSKQILLFQGLRSMIREKCFQF